MPGKKRYSSKLSRKPKSRKISIPRIIYPKYHNFRLHDTKAIDVWADLSAQVGMDSMGGGFLTGLDTYQLSDITSIANYTTIFERFRLNRITVEIVHPQSQTAGYINTGSGVTNTAKLMCLTLVSKDTSRINLNAGLDAAMLRSGVKSHNLVSRFPAKVSWVPNILVQTYETAALTGYTDKKAPLLYVEESGHVHYGLAYGFFRVDGQSMNPAVGPVTGKVMFKITYDCTFTGQY
jgi:hypothetical protein